MCGLVGLVLGLYFGLSQEDEPENLKTLKNYVYNDDGYFSWSRTAWKEDYQKKNDYDQLVKRLHLQNIDLIRMTSQKWTNSSYVSKSIWEHNVWICTPNATDVSVDSALLWIENGNNDEYRVFRSIHDYD